MAGPSKSTVYVTSGTTVGVGLNWTSIKPTSNCYFDVNKIDASKMILLVAHASTKAKAGAQYVYIGSSSTADSASTKLPYSAGKRAKFSLTTGDSYFKIDSRDAGTSGLFAVTILGPFETAKYKDADGYINMSVLTSGCTATLVSAIAIK